LSTFSQGIRIRLKGIGLDRENGDFRIAGVGSPGANQTRGFDSTHSRHPAIHKHQRITCLRQGFDSLNSIPENGPGFPSFPIPLLATV